MIRVALILLTVFAAAACGDDDDDGGGSKDAGPSSSAGREGRAGSGGSRARPAGSGATGGAGSGSPAIEVQQLPDRTAGKDCGSDQDCGTGMCLAELPGAFGAGMMEAPDGYCSGRCLANTDCGEGGACVGALPTIGNIAATPGRCLKSCADTSECRDGYRCVNGLGLPLTATPDGGTPMTGAASAFNATSTCQPAPATDTLEDGVVGSACGGDEDCSGGRCLTMTNTASYPNGYCSGRCLSDEDCGSKGSCTPGLVGGAGTCYLRCASDDDCDREGYRCRSTGGSRMQCVPGAAPLPDDVVGSACTADADCGGAAMSCGTRLGRNTAPGGYCTQRCVNSSDCGSGGVCVGGIGGATATGACYRACEDATGCREGYSCSPAGRTGTAAMQNICSVTPPPPPPDTEIDAGL